MSQQNGINQLSSEEKRWFAVRTRPKSEKFVKKMLEKKEVLSYLPLQQIMRKYTRSKRLVEKPLFHSYIFVKITKDQYVPVLETEHVTGFVKFNKDLIAIPESEIAVVRRITMEGDLDIEVVPGMLAEGDLVEIAAGALIGLKGWVIKQEGKRKFQVELASLGMSLLISVDAAFLEKLPPNARDAY
jgi:transcription antitermination factor NusG